MGEIRLFHVIYGGSHRLAERPFQKERELQRLFEAQLPILTGINFLSTEYQADGYGRIDTLGIDSQGRPVVIEYKRRQNDSIINQGLHYLDWLQSHRANIELLVRDSPSVRDETRIDFRGAWLLCVARNFTEWDLSTAKGVSRRVELVSCRRFVGESGSNLLLEWVWPERSIVSDSRSEPDHTDQPDPITPCVPKRLHEHQDQLRADLRNFLRSLGNDVTVQKRKHVINFVRRRSFASEVVSIKSKLVVVVRLEPGTMTLIPGFTRDVSNVGHQGNGNLEVTIFDQAALERAKPLLRDAYNRN